MWCNGYTGAVVALALVATLTTRPASAGLLDSPAPSFTGGAGTIVYRMGPVYHDPGWVGTYIACTNVGSAAAEIALELFDELDDVVGSVTRTTVAAGERATFAVASPPSEAAAQHAVAVTGIPELDHGKARVSSPATTLTCMAWLRIASADGTVKDVPLELVKKVAF
jgi:hypothetical protein